MYLFAIVSNSGSLHRLLQIYMLPSNTLACLHQEPMPSYMYSTAISVSVSASSKVPVFIPTYTPHNPPPDIGRLQDPPSFHLPSTFLPPVLHQTHNNSHSQPSQVLPISQYLLKHNYTPPRYYRIMNPCYPPTYLLTDLGSGANLNSTRYT